jgi:hypothetical protein
MMPSSAAGGGLGARGGAGGATGAGGYKILRLAKHVDQIKDLYSRAVEAVAEEGEEEEGEQPPLLQPRCVHEVVLQVDQVVR